MALGLTSGLGYLPTALVAVMISLIALFLIKLSQARMVFVRLRKQGVVSQIHYSSHHYAYHSSCYMLYTKNKRAQPMPPKHSFAFGHLLFLKSVINTLPADAHKMLVFGEILHRFFPQRGLYYIDLWPFSEPFLIVMKPTIAIQATQTNLKVATERPPALSAWFLPLAGGPNLFDLPGKDWKPWRAVFNKGFSADHLLSLVPNMVEEILVYRETLQQHAQRGTMFCLDPITLRLMMDLIGRTVLWVFDHLFCSKN